MIEKARILVVDDNANNVKLLQALLEGWGYDVLTATSGEDGLRAVAESHPDLVLLDVQMPGMDGYEVCRRLRDDPATTALPVIMVTASEVEAKIKGLESGTDDFMTKPVDKAELKARVSSLLRIKRYQDTISTQAAELEEWNRVLESRVAEQVSEIERLGRLRRFLTPQIAEMMLSSDDESMLEPHRREIAVFFCDLRGFTGFSRRAEPEDVVRCLQEYYGVLGELVQKYDATVGHFAGDGMMAYFNDPIPCSDPATRAVQMALDLRTPMAELIERWERRGDRLSYGVGIAFGYATLGLVFGFEGRRDYGPVGTVANLGARLCAEAAPGEILIDGRTYAGINGLVEVEQVEGLSLKGFEAGVTAYRVLTPVTQP